MAFCPACGIEDPDLERGEWCDMCAPPAAEWSGVVHVPLPRAADVTPAGLRDELRQGPPDGD